MGSRFYRPKRDDRVSVGHEVLRPHAHNIAVQQLIPRLAVENQIALETISIPMFFYAKIRGGRRCSCFDIEASPASMCRSCYGTGFVGGYDKYGTYTEVFDVTHPSIRSYNVIADYTRRTRPRHFVLIPGATDGYVVARMPIRTNVGELDHVFAMTEIPPGSAITPYVKAPGDTEWVPFSSAAITQRLFNPWIDFRVDFSRSSPIATSPRFGLLFIRYNQLVDRTIRANIPRTAKSNMLQEFGVTDNWEAQHFWLDNTLRSITTEDWVAHVNENTRWKINTVNEFAPEDLLVAWDLDTRLIHPYESQVLFPL